MTVPSPSVPSTPEASSAMAQSRDVVSEKREPAVPLSEPVGYCIGQGVLRATQVRPYERRHRDPIYRPLQIYTLDPSASQREGAITRVNVPYEPLEPGPKGCLFSVEEDLKAGKGLTYQVVNLDDPLVLLEGGRRPSPSDPQFHHQMVYAVCSLIYAAFRKALGRDLTWGFSVDLASNDRVRLRIRPHAFQGENAWYDQKSGILNFGYFCATNKTQGRNLPGGFTFTCLSHDIITHEITHALLDGLRANFTIPSNPDVLAFHEAFADLVAIFQRFSYPDVVQAALRKARGKPEQSVVLTSLASQMAQATGYGEYIRSAINSDEEGHPLQLDSASQEPHERGKLLISAVFDAFATVFQRKAAPILRLATGGTGVLPEGDLSVDLINALSEKASTIAGQFLTICIRAVDYCPPVDIEFGEFLRAVITADYDLIPDDPWGYREAWIDAFWKRGIYPSNVTSLSEDALLWERPIEGTSVVDLSFGKLEFGNGPNQAANQEEIERQARALGSYLSTPERLLKFGFALPEPDVTISNRVSPPCVQSIRPSRRIGPDGQVIFDLVAEVTQTSCVEFNGIYMEFYGGATFILGPSGEVRYVISKRCNSRRRLERQKNFIRTEEGKKYWQTVKKQLTPLRDGTMFCLLHDKKTYENQIVEKK